MDENENNIVHQTDIIESYYKGIDLYSSGKYEEALIEFEKIIQKYPDDESILIKIADILSLLGRDKEVIDIYNMIIALNPIPSKDNDWLNIFDVWELNIAAIKKTGKYEGALIKLEEIIQQYPDDEYSLKLFADILSLLGRDKEVIDICNMIIALNPTPYGGNNWLDIFDVWELKIAAIQKLGTDEEIIAEYDKIINDDKNIDDILKKRVMNLKGNHLVQIGKYCEAIKTFETSGNLLIKCYILIKMGLYEEAVEVCDEIIPKNIVIIQIPGYSIYKKLFTPPFNINEFSFDKDMVSDIIPIINRDDNYQKDFVDGHIACCLKGEIFYFKELYEKSIQAFENAGEWGIRGKILYKLGRYEEAIKSYENAIRENEFVRNSHVMGELWRLKAECYTKLEQYEMALKDLEWGFQYCQDSFLLYLSKLDIFIAQEKYEAARVICEYLIQIDPTNERVLQRKGAILYKLGRYSDADIFFFKRNLRINLNMD